ncbi:hypothetical protein COLO4_01233 [Corchorus olitorius]|uniref:Uncharacterized protein n=1 Tax=Corchorus olitorius TaxID=93759 RepID=A0A1R3L2W7_9ROSI|nr:hypothetical protein COLO4_01233 [Corchorus olitorius]
MSVLPGKVKQHGTGSAVRPRNIYISSIITPRFSDLHRVK